MGFFNKSLKSLASITSLDDIVDVVGDIVTSSKTNSKSSVLDTPDAPAVPKIHPTMSVMVAVNGQSYGPYERATLLKMISDGSLTKETLVFINGMSNWQPAAEVPEVAKLFALNAPAPAIPPIPWSEKPQNTSTTSSAAPTQNNNFSQRLNNLITAAVADGEISDLERQVLIRNAQEEGVAMDEFVMVLEARLYEQRRSLQAEEEAKTRTAIIAQQQAQIPNPPTNHQQKNTDRPTKCPNCGAPVSSFATKCPDCGWEYTHSVHGNYTPWEELTAKLESVSDNSKPGFLKMMGIDNSVVERKTQIIQTFPVPSDKRGLMEFFINCAPLAKTSKFTNSGSMEQIRLAPAYKAKAIQVLTKAKILLKDDPALLEEMFEIAKANKIKFK